MAKQLGEFAKISVPLLPSARDDSRVNFSASRKIKQFGHTGVGTTVERSPKLVWNERHPRHFISLLLDILSTADLQVIENDLRAADEV